MMYQPITEGSSVCEISKHKIECGHDQGPGRERNNNNNNSYE